MNISVCFFLAAFTWQLRPYGIAVHIGAFRRRRWPPGQLIRQQWWLLVIVLRLVKQLSKKMETAYTIVPVHCYVPVERAARLVQGKTACVSLLSPDWSPVTTVMWCCDVLACIRSVQDKESAGRRHWQSGHREPPTWHPFKHKRLSLYWTNVGTASKTVAWHWSNQG